jgi:hypothetical protein
MSEIESQRRGGHRLKIGIFWMLPVTKKTRSWLNSLVANEATGPICYRVQRQSSELNVVVGHPSFKHTRKPPQMILI